MMPIEILFALGQPSGGGSGGEGGIMGSLTAFLPIILIFVIFYFLLIRPQQKRQKEHQRMINELKKGDNVVTAGGIHGTIVGVAENTATVEIAPNVRIKVTRSSIAAVNNMGDTGK